MPTAPRHLTPDQKAAELAARAFGAFTRADALEAGISPKAIRYRLEVGRWESLYPSVYAIAGALRRQLTTLGALDHCLFLTARRGRNGCAVLRDIVRSRRMPQHMLTGRWA